jgi:tetratricopeptide (TPR) repeat protein
LVDKSLLQSETVDDETRYRLLESIRQYAEEKLEEPERSKIIYTHAHLFAELAEQMDQESASTPDQIWSQRAKLELENWRSVLRWSLQERNDLLLGQRLTAAMRSIWCRLGPVEGQRWVRAALDSSDAHTPVQIVALLFLTQAHLAMLLTEYHTGAAAAKNALELLKQINDVEHGSEAQLFAGAALALLGDTASGESMLNAALGNFRVRGKNRQVAAALQYLGLMHVSMGNVRQARSFFTEALAIFKATSGAERSAAHIALALAETEFRAGDPARALQLAAEALSLDRARNDESLVVFDLCNVSAYLIALDRLDEASATALEALSLARETHVDAGIIVALQHVAACAALPGANGSYENTGVAARLIGFVDCRIAQLDYRRDYTEQQEYERIVRCFTHFSTPEYESLKREGAAWSETYACEVASQIASLQT